MMSVIGKTLFCFVVVLSVLAQGETTTLIDLLVSSTPTEEDSLAEILTTTPEPPHDPFRFLILCAPGSNNRNTCEKCTKVTKDPNTYQMCCENTRGVRTWCEKFLNPSSWMVESNSGS